MNRFHKEQIILHISHSSRLIPQKYRNDFLLSDEELEKELLLMTDAYTDMLFNVEGLEKIVFPVSRLLVDPERFVDDSMEEMAKFFEVIFCC